MKIVTAEEMRQLERGAAKLGVSADVLMEKAGLAVAKEVRRHCGGVIGRRVTVLVGPGNNGGDGLVAARHLHRWGAMVYIYLCQRGEGQPGDDRNLRLALEMGIPTAQVSQDTEMSCLQAWLASADVVLDALLGTGKARLLEGFIAQAIQKVRQAKAARPQMTVVALDLPTGLNPDTGAADPHGLEADITITLGYPKRGLFAFPGALLVGQLRVVDIGLPPSLGQEITLELITPEWVASALPPRPPDANKGTFGRVLVVAGSINYIGAAHLACSGATRSGAGLVTLATPRSLVPILAGRLTEVTYLPLPEALPGTLSGSAEGLETAQAYTVCLMGCGLGQGAGAASLVKQVLFSGKLSPKGWVVDADALNLLSRVPQWWQNLAENVILTPHPGEMARLSGLSIEEIQADRLRVAREAARKWGKTVVLKGAYTVVAEPGGGTRLSPFANPTLASAGTGDVMAGVIAGLAAQGLSPWDAAACGVYLHGAAGELVRREAGDTGPLASDLLAALPRTIKALKQGQLPGKLE